MNSLRPLIVVPHGDSVDRVLHYAGNLLDESAEATILIQPPEQHAQGMRHVLNSWKCSAQNVEAVEKKCRLVRQHFESLERECRIETVCDVSPWQLPFLSAKFDADLVIVPAYCDSSVSASRRACADEDLIARSPVPVFIVGQSASSNGPIVAVVDSLTEATGNKPATDSASDIIAATQQVSETCSGTSRVVVIAFETDQPTLYAGQHCIPVRGRKDLIASIDCLDPSTVVIGRPGGTTLQRCFSTTMVSSVLSCGHNVFFPGPSRLLAVSRDQSGTKWQQRQENSLSVS